MMLQRRSFWAYIGLTIITCGIYQWFFVYQMQRDINIACQGDGRDLDPVIALIFALFLPGIFNIFWLYTQGERIRMRGEYSNIRILDTGLGYVLWTTLGSCIVVGPLIAMYKFITNSNFIFDDFNRRNYRGYNNGQQYNNYNNGQFNNYNNGQFNNNQQYYNNNQFDYQNQNNNNNPYYNQNNNQNNNNQNNNNNF